MLHSALSALAALPLLAGPAAAAPFGAPTICQPIDIGQAKTLPWDGGAFGRAKGYDVSRTVGDTLGMLVRVDDALFHMETIRRAAIYLTGAESGDWKKDPRTEARIHELLSRLRKRVLELEVAPKAPPEALGLAWFDLGYALVALEHCGFQLDDGSAQAFARAVELRPADGGLRLGAALGSFGREGSEADRREHFAAAARLAKDPDGLLRKNLVACGARFLGAKTYDGIVARVGG